MIWENMGVFVRTNEHFFVVTLAIRCLTMSSPGLSIFIVTVRTFRYA